MSDGTRRRDDCAHGGSPYWLSTVDPGEFPPLAGIPARAQVAVIGGGIMGAAATYWLARRGGDVLLLERGELAQDASGRNAGMALHSSHPIEDAGLVERVLHDERIDAEYRSPGHLALASTPEVWERIRTEVAGRDPGLPPLAAVGRTDCEGLIGMRLSHRFLGGRWFPAGRVVHPVRLVHGLAAAARRHGAAVATHVEVHQISPRPGGWRLDTSRGQVRADQVLFACGAAVAGFVPWLLAAFRPVRAQMMSTCALPRLFRIGLAVDWGTVYWRQNDAGTVLVGGCREEEVAAAEPAGLVDAAIQTELERFLPQTFPDFPRFTVARRWAGVMDRTADQRPMIGQLPAPDGRWLVCGFGGHGLPAGIGAGKVVADGILTGRLRTGLSEFDPGRFARPATGARTAEVASG